MGPSPGSDETLSASSPSSPTLSERVVNSASKY